MYSLLVCHEKLLVTVVENVGAAKKAAVAHLEAMEAIGKKVKGGCLFLPLQRRRSECGVFQHRHRQRIGSVQHVR